MSDLKRNYPKESAADRIKAISAMLKELLDACNDGLLNDDYDKEEFAKATKVKEILMVAGIKIDMAAI